MMTASHGLGMSAVPEASLQRDHSMSLWAMVMGTTQLVSMPTASRPWIKLKAVNQEGETVHCAQSLWTAGAGSHLNRKSIATWKEKESDFVFVFTGWLSGYTEPRRFKKTWPLFGGPYWLDIAEMDRKHLFPSFWEFLYKASLIYEALPGLVTTEYRRRRFFFVSLEHISWRQDCSAVKVKISITLSMMTLT